MMKTPFLLTAATAVLLTSCVTTDPYTGEQRYNRTTLGAGQGAAAGALLGAVIGNNTGDSDAGRGALIGGLLGAAVGGGIGNYMDQQEAAIRQQLQGSGVSVTRQGNNLILNMPHDITFGVDRDQIRPEFTQTLDSVALVLRKYDKTLISVDGHTDSTGAASYNVDLSQRRAGSVANYLASRGVAGQRLVTQGFGETAPIASNSTSAGRAQNRRVELRIVPQQQQFR